MAELGKTLHGSASASGNPVGPVVCKTMPYNVCYRVDKQGKLHPVGNRRPLRVLRVY